MLAIDRACCRDTVLQTLTQWRQQLADRTDVLPSEASGLESRTLILGATKVKASGLNRPRSARSSCAWSGSVC
jgi:hypothetical protein